MKMRWFTNRRGRYRDLIENTFRDLREVDNAPKSSIDKVLSFLYKEGFLEEED